MQKFLSKLNVMEDFVFCLFSTNENTAFSGCESNLRKPYPLRSGKYDLRHKSDELEAGHINFRARPDPAPGSDPEEEDEDWKQNDEDDDPCPVQRRPALCELPLPICPTHESFDRPIHSVGYGEYAHVEQHIA